VFEQLGVALDYPEAQTCCGQPAFNSGYNHEAKAAARRFVEIFADSQAIVCPSGSCVHMVRHYYPLLFRDEDEMTRKRVDRLASRCYEFTEYLVDVLGVENVKARFPARVTYHDSCHLLRGLQVAEQPRRLLEAVNGIEFIEMKDSDICCGFGGTFSVNYPDISTAMVDQKIDNIIASGAEFVTGCDMGCLMNIQGRLSRRQERVKVKHIAEILASSGVES
ncbi:MAG: (Fe-S)-binding protein, partial [Deltaproteobacteria bacterium]|nr:(Fe-S)-binding protein [Deltaproteobacteria bacterium]